MSVVLNEEERKASVEEASSVPLDTSFRMAVRRRWDYFHKPLLSIVVGAVVFGTGTALSLLYFTHVGNVPYLVGPLFLSMGLMFLVTGLVWIPIIKQKMVHTAMSQMGHDRPLLPQRGSCATIS
ncbi:phosphoinositide-interacting protein-like [Hoplias malabaricus]|uniref:phosphoinositide-interacting protein-like n=1 Tax=Hoplias malabaricus TaxID=27720 RepID=UPI003461BF61